MSAVSSSVKEFDSFSISRFGVPRRTTLQRPCSVLRVGSARRSTNSKGVPWTSLRNYEWHAPGQQMLPLQTCDRDEVGMFLRMNHSN
jgi:hypothetical protein